MILAVEDSEQIRKVLSITLKSKNYNVLEAESGTEALKIFEQHQFDLIILDLGLPDIDGLEVLKSLRKKTDIPVIILTVRNDEETREEAMNLGANQYITKPFDPIKLVDEIDAQLAKKT